MRAHSARKPVHADFCVQIVYSEVETARKPVHAEIHVITGACDGALMRALQRLENYHVEVHVRKRAFTNTRPYQIPTAIEKQKHRRIHGSYEVRTLRCGWHYRDSMRDHVSLPMLRRS